MTDSNIQHNFVKSRFLITSEDYLKKHHLLDYMEDCVEKMLVNKDVTDPKHFITQYFAAVRDGHHVMFREYSYVQLTPHNRISFIRLCWNCFKQIGRTKDLLSIHEYHSLITLLCPDFPFDLLYKTVRIILHDDALDCLVSFSDFIHAFQLQFFYQEFLDKVFEVYDNLHKGEVTGQETVIVPSAGDSSASSYVSVIHDGKNACPDGVNCQLFFHRLVPLCGSPDFSSLDIETLRATLSHQSHITYYEFLMLLVRSVAVNNSIGVLPDKSEIFSDIAITSRSPKQKTQKQAQKQKHPLFTMRSNVSDTPQTKNSKSQTVLTCVPSAIENSKSDSVLELNNVVKSARRLDNLKVTPVVSAEISGVDGMTQRSILSKSRAPKKHTVPVSAAAKLLLENGGRAGAGRSGLQVNSSNIARKVTDCSDDSGSDSVSASTNTTSSSN